MIKSHEQPAPVSFAVQRGDRRIRLTYQQVFVAAHKLWLAERYSEAADVFKQLSVVLDRGPRAHILLAHCKVMIGDYAGCSSTLAEALEAPQFGNAAAELHSAFVMWKCTLYVDVKAELENVIAEHPELPTPCLLLAELLMQSGNRKHPPRLLKQAIARDRPDGAIASIARSELPFAIEMAGKQPVKRSISTDQPVRNSMRA